MLSEFTAKLGPALYRAGDQIIRLDQVNAVYIQDGTKVCLLWRGRDKPTYIACQTKADATALFESIYNGLSHWMGNGNDESLIPVKLPATLSFKE